jgi:hypothetical protein
LYSAVRVAFSNVLKWRLKPTTAADVSSFTESWSRPTACNVNT